jgi:hypothetical protein
MELRQAMRFDDPSPSLLEPDSIVPAQYFDRGAISAGTQPEKRLMLAVLEDAITTFQRHLQSGTRRSRRLVEDVEAWTAGNGGEGSFSFEEVCAALDLEPEYLRAGLARWKEAELRRVRLGQPSLYRPPVRRVSGRRHRITGPREYYRKSA